MLAQEVTFAPNARREMAKDRVSEDAVRGVIADPGHVGPANHPSPIRRRFWKGGVNVVLEPNPFSITVLTGYKD